MRKRTIVELKARDHLKLSELSRLCDVPYGVIKFYYQLGLLRCFRNSGRAPYVDKNHAIQILNRIALLKNKGMNMSYICKEIGTVDPILIETVDSVLKYHYKPVRQWYDKKVGPVDK